MRIIFSGLITTLQVNISTFGTIFNLRTMHPDCLLLWHIVWFFLRHLTSLMGLRILLMSMSNIQYCDDSHSESSRISAVNVRIKEITDRAYYIQRRNGKTNSWIPSSLVKECIGIFVQSSKNIYNLLLNTKSFPDHWNSSDKSGINNYRQISILQNDAMLYEYYLQQYLPSKLKHKFHYIIAIFVRTIGY